jgi:hypothetical protein
VPVGQGAEPGCSVAGPEPERVELTRVRANRSGRSAARERRGSPSATSRRHWLNRGRIDQGRSRCRRGLAERRGQAGSGWICPRAGDCGCTGDVHHVLREGPGSGAVLLAEGQSFGQRLAGPQTDVSADSSSGLRRDRLGHGDIASGDKNCLQHPAYDAEMLTNQPHWTPDSPPAADQAAAIRQP